MLVTLALIVFITSIGVFFSDEIIRFVVKVWGIPGFKLLGPLIFVSWLVIIFEEYSYWFLLQTQIKFTHGAQALAQHFPFDFGALLIAKMVYLFLLACLTPWVFLLMAKRHGSLEEYRLISYRLGVILWIFGMMLLIM